MVQRYFDEIKQKTWNRVMPALAYMGDSTNDGPLFAAIALSIGVANVSPYLPQLEKENKPPNSSPRAKAAMASPKLSIFSFNGKTLPFKALKYLYFHPTRG